MAQEWAGFDRRAPCAVRRAQWDQSSFLVARWANPSSVPVSIFRKSDSEGTKTESYPPRLPGGQQQQVAIARALAMDPDFMLFDQSTSSLDSELIGDVQVAIDDLAADGMTMVIVSHGMDFAGSLADIVNFIVASPSQTRPK